jgi:plasmid stabilization system protein ParE
MDRKIIWTERASADVEAIVRYIARRDPEASVRVGYGIYDRVQILQLHPEAGSIFSELRSGRWRKLVFSRGKIIYKVQDDVIIIGRGMAGSFRRSRFQNSSLRF